MIRFDLRLECDSLFDVSMALNRLHEEMSSLAAASAELTRADGVVLTGADRAQVGRWDFQVTES